MYSYSMHKPHNEAFPFFLKQKKKDFYIRGSIAIYLLLLRTNYYTKTHLWRVDVFLMFYYIYNQGKERDTYQWEMIYLLQRPYA